MLHERKMSKRTTVPFAQDGREIPQLNHTQQQAGSWEPTCCKVDRLWQKNYTGARSARFERMDVDPPENDDRQEPIAADDSCNVRVEDKDNSVNDSWRMRVEALFTSLDKAKHFICVQPMKWQEILMSFLWMAHLYKPSDGYKIRSGRHSYTFGEVQ